MTKTSQSFNAEMVDILQKAIKEIILSGTASASLGGAGNSQSYTRLDLPSLQKLLDSYQTRLGAENGKGGFRRMLARF